MMGGWALSTCRGADGIKKKLPTPRAQAQARAQAHSLFRRSVRTSSFSARVIWMKCLYLRTGDYTMVTRERIVCVVKARKAC